MEIQMLFKRILAFIFDFYFSIFLGAFIIGGVIILLDESFQIVQSLGVDSITIDTLFGSNNVGVNPFPLLLLTFWAVGWPSLFLGACSHFFGRSPGKGILRLRIIDFQGEKPSFSTAFGRELVKLVSLFIPFFWVLPLIQVILQGSTFYDQLFRTSVIGKPKRTAVQKKYEKYYGNR
jgi:uncharacterized RDD family membrane protein YckC